MADVTSKTDLIYDEQFNMKTDVYYVDLDHLAGTIIDIHGGGWFRGDKAKDADWATSLAQAGYLVFVPNYRITPDYFYPAPLEDMDNLMEWLDASEYPVDRKHLAVVGSSAGGNMSVEMGIKYGIPIVSLSGIFDIEDWLNDHQDLVGHPDTTQDFTNTASAGINQTGADDGFYKWFIVNYFNNQTDQYHEATPYYHVTDQTGPMFLANSLEEFVPTSGVISMSKALSAHKIPHTTRMMTGTKHAKGYLDLVYDDVLSFIERNI